MTFSSLSELNSIVNLPALSTILGFFSPLIAASTAEYWYGWANTLWSITQVGLGLGFVIFVHELGHFLAAKYFGVKCEKFYVGFDVPIKIGPIRLPAKLFHFQWGETEYGIGSIPLGGYVKMLGQDDDPRNAEKEAARIRLENPANTNLADQSAIPAGPVQFDPRSFPAKSVFARMVIISAGVIMNVIFGVIFAAIAFRVGVPYEPTIVGDVLPGDPAWLAGLQSGDKIVKIAEMSEPDQQLAFRDLREMVAMSGFDHPDKPIPIEVIRDGKSVEMNVVGTKRHDPEGKLLTTGFTIAGTTELDGEPIRPTLSSRWPKKADDNQEESVYDDLPPFKAGDKIVGINGISLPIEGGLSVPLEKDLNQILHPLMDKTVNLQVKRKSATGSSTSGDSTESEETVDVEMKPNPIKTLGFGFAPGKVVAIQEGSPAAKAGAKIGDTLVQFDGKPIDDAFKLPLAVARKKGASVKLTLQRSSPSSKSSNESSTPETYDIEWTVPEKFTIADNGLQFNPVGIEPIGAGLVYEPQHQVASISPELSSDSIDLQVNDSIKQLQFEIPENKEVEAEFKKMFRSNWKELSQGLALTGGYTPQYLNAIVQILPVGTKLRIYFEREKSVKNVVLQVRTDPQWNNPDRGLLNKPASLTKRIDSLSDAFYLGAKETFNRGMGVIRFVRLGITGKIPSNAPAGPTMIFYVATSTASESTTKLLMFLTMLSANLAVINFLPIPALDGGHMVFLLWEGITGKPVNENVQMRLTIVGVLSLLGLMLFVTYNDISTFIRFFG